jgi:hypothetical protein
MRPVLLALALVVLPVPALAICACSCVQGEAVARCTLESDVPPPCQILCMPSAQLPSVELPGSSPPRPDPLIIEEERGRLREQGIIPPEYIPPAQPERR